MDEVVVTHLITLATIINSQVPHQIIGEIILIKTIITTEVVEIAEDLMLIDKIRTIKDNDVVTDVDRICTLQGTASTEMMMLMKFKSSYSLNNHMRMMKLKLK